MSISAEYDTISSVSGQCEKALGAYTIDPLDSFFSKKDREMISETNQAIRIPLD